MILVTFFCQVGKQIKARINFTKPEMCPGYREGGQIIIRFKWFQ